MCLQAYGKCELCAVLTRQMEAPDAAEVGVGPEEPVCPMEDFPLQQSQEESLRHAFNEVEKKVWLPGAS